MSLVSIIVPVFNVEKKLSVCLNSLLRQTYGDIEIILINDGSKDKSGLICDKYSKIDSRIQTIHMNNSGVSGARNKGLELAKAPYVMFVDSDDSVESGLVESLLNRALDEKADFVMCGYKKVFKTNDEIKSIQHFQCEPYTGDSVGFLENIVDYVGKPFLQGPCWKLFKRDIISTYNILFPEKMSYGEDTVFVYTFLKYAIRISVINEELYRYNVYNDESLSRVFRQDKFEINLYLLELLEELFLEHKLAYDESFLNSQICGSYISYMGGIWNSDHKLDYKLRHRIILNAIAKNETHQAFKALEYYSKQNKLLYILISKEQIILIDFYFFIKEKVRKNIYQVFKIAMKVWGRNKK